jgi:hypothetical protein
MMFWTDTAWLPDLVSAAHGQWIEIDASSPEIRRDGGVVAAARQRVAEFATDDLWGRHVAFPGRGSFQILSAWVLDYSPGHFAALHTDRPDSDLTGLLALDNSNDPLVVCPKLAARSATEVVEIAADTPHPAGTSIVLRREEVLMIEGARVPHHRPPVRQACRVLSISLRHLPDVRT